MTAHNTIEEKERFVKVYDLELFGKDIAELVSKKIDEKLIPVTEKLDDISANTRGLVTQEQHCKDIGDLEERIDLKYGGTKKGFSRIGWMFAAGTVGVITGFIGSILSTIGNNL